MGITRLYIQTKISIWISTFFQHIYIFKLIFHNMIYKIRTNNWRTEKFLSIHCFLNSKCNTHYDWLVEKQLTQRFDFWEGAHEYKKITFVTCELFRRTTNFVALRSWCFREYGHWSGITHSLYSHCGFVVYFYLITWLCSHT